jgi:DNA-binding SARP family transcriptional activator
MLRDNRFRLVTLGRLTLVGTGGEEDASLARRRLKLAVLAVLALARRPISRDTLLGLFWAEHDEPRARHSLSNALSSLRGALGERSITTRDAEVALDPETPLDVDAVEFIEALENKDFARAVGLYAGSFLEGFHVDESPAFDQWVSRERRRLESLFIKACSEHCGSLARSRRWIECEQVANRWLETEPLSADAAIYYLNAIKSPGTRAALAKALEEFEALRTRLNHEFELAPHPSVMELSTRIREQLAKRRPSRSSISA